ncbi:MAG TPA: signal peptidase II [Candidatus Nanoarchaeia archaeon]|nr:signal peptidase II [Candidatus Nanoarchaeia archaeon]
MSSLSRPVKFFTLITISIVLLDQLTKYLVLTLKPNLNLGLLSIHYITNTGAGFGILKGQTLLLALISLIAALTLIIGYKKIDTQKIPQILFALFLGGVIGNMIDRVFRHQVIDYLDFHFWPAFNLADSAITAAVAGLIIYYWKK